MDQKEPLKSYAMAANMEQAAKGMFMRGPSVNVWTLTGSDDADLDGYVIVKIEIGKPLVKVMAFVDGKWRVVPQ